MEEGGMVPALTLSPLAGISLGGEVQEDRVGWGAMGLRGTGCSSVSW